MMMWNDTIAERYEEEGKERFESDFSASEIRNTFQMNYNDTECVLVQFKSAIVMLSERKQDGLWEEICSPSDMRRLDMVSIGSEYSGRSYFVSRGADGTDKIMSVSAEKNICEVAYTFTQGQLVAFREASKCNMTTTDGKMRPSYKEPEEDDPTLCCISAL